MIIMYLNILLLKQTADCKALQSQIDDLSMEPWNEKSQVAQEGVTNGLCEHFEHRDFFASTRTDKKFALREASSLESTTREQRPLLIFSACSNPYANPFL